MADRRCVMEICGLLAAAYPRFELQAQTIEVYARCLTDLPDAVLEAAAKDCIARSRFFPTVAELREAAHGITHAGEETAFEAWEQVMRSFRMCDQCPSFRNPRIKKALDGIGGWRLVGLSDNTVADRARFIQAYNVYQERDKRQQLSLPEVRRLAEGLKMGIKMLR